MTVPLTQAAVESKTAKDARAHLGDVAQRCLHVLLELLEDAKDLSGPGLCSMGRTPKERH